MAKLNDTQINGDLKVTGDIDAGSGSVVTALSFEATRGLNQSVAGFNGKAAYLEGHYAQNGGRDAPNIGGYISKTILASELPLKNYTRPGTTSNGFMLQHGSNGGYYADILLMNNYSNAADASPCVTTGIGVGKGPDPYAFVCSGPANGTEWNTIKYLSFEGHTHNYAGSSSHGGAATSANKVNSTVTFNAGGSGAVSGTTFDGSAAATISYNTIGAVPNTAAGASALINLLGLGTSAPQGDDYYIAQYAGGGIANTSYYRRPVSKLWEYIKSQADTVYDAKNSASTLQTKITNGTVAANKADMIKIGSKYYTATLSGATLTFTST